LGHFENETVNVKIEIHQDIEVMFLNLGYIKTDDIRSLLDVHHINTNITINSSNINIKVYSKEESILFVPLAYNRFYKLSNTSNELFEVYNGYIGLTLNKGYNDITIEFHNRDIHYGLIMSLLGLGLAILLSYFKIYQNKVIKNIVYYTYTSLFILAIILIYFIPALFFIFSFIR